MQQVAVLNWECSVFLVDQGDAKSRKWVAPPVFPVCDRNSEVTIHHVRECMQFSWRFLGWFNEQFTVATS